MNIVKIPENKLDLKYDDDKLRIVFLGTGSAFAKRNRQSNILIMKGKDHVLVDCGTQGPLALNDIGLSVLDIRCVLPTHSHADHVGGLEEMALTNRYVGSGRQNMIILRDYQDLLWSKTLAGGCEFCEAEQGKSLQITDFFNILRPETISIDGEKYWKYQYGDLEIVLMRTRHFPDSAVEVDQSQWCNGVYINNQVWISGDTMFDYNYPVSFADKSEVLFHDCQMFTGGVHASYEELFSLPKEVRNKMLLYHYSDNYDKPETWVGKNKSFTGNPDKDKFLGWATQQVIYEF